MLASSFIFGGKGYIRLQKTNIKDEYRPLFKFAPHSTMIYPNAWNRLAKWLQVYEGIWQYSNIFSVIKNVN